MNEQTMIWFLKKSAQHQLSREAVMLWMDFYAYLQNLSRARYPRIGFVELRSICDLEQEQFLAACRELEAAAMLKMELKQGRLYCQLVAGRLYKTPHTTAG